jgi:hypothetical protein
LNPVVQSIVVALVSASATLIVARYGLLGKKVDSDINAASKFLERLVAVEKRERQCQKQLFLLRQYMQVLEVMVDLLIQAHPDDDGLIAEARQRMVARRRALQHEGESDE